MLELTQGGSVTNIATPSSFLSGTNFLVCVYLLNLMKKLCNISSFSLIPALLISLLYRKAGKAGKGRIFMIFTLLASSISMQAG